MIVRRTDRVVQRRAGPELLEEVGHELALSVRVDLAHARPGKSVAVRVEGRADRGVKCGHDALDRRCGLGLKLDDVVEDVARVLVDREDNVPLPPVLATISLRSTCRTPGCGAGEARVPECEAFLMRAVAQASHGATAEADERFLGASEVAKCDCLILPMPACERRCMSSAAFAAGRWPTCDADPTRWNPSGAEDTPAARAMEEAATESRLEAAAPVPVPGRPVPTALMRRTVGIRRSFS